MREFIIKGCTDLVVIDCNPSQECKRYHENSCLQINIGDKTIIKRVKDGTSPTSRSTEPPTA